MPSQSLEQQALDRVARMYSSFDRQTRHAPPQPKPEQEPEPIKEPAPEDTAVDKTPSGLLDVLFKDKEQSLLLLLLVILMKDGADMNTVLALMYLLI